MTIHTEAGKYLTNDLNFECYQELTEGTLKGVFEPTEFFEVFNESYALIIAYRSNPLIAIEKLRERIANYTIYAQCYIYNCLEDRLTIELKQLYIKEDEQIKICLNLITKELNKHVEEEATPEIDKNKFNWHNTKQHIDSLPDDTSKIACLINISAQYRQEQISNSKLSTGFYEKCNIEIERIKEIQVLEAMKAPYSGNVYLSRKKGKKVNFIRVINALYELRYFQDGEDQIPSKETVMVTIGKALGVDLASYDSDLSQALSTGNSDKNTTIFKQMMEITEDQVLTRNVTKK